MASISEIIAELSSARSRIERSLRITVTRSAEEWRSAFVASSPVKTGTFKAGWRLGRASSGNGVDAAVSITNNVPHAGVIEFGVDPGSTTDPWAKALARTKKRKGKKIVKAMGIMPKAMRIWSTSAIGGVSAKNITNSKVRDLGRNVADAIISALSGK